MRYSVSVFAVAVLLAFPAPAVAGDRECVGGIGPVVVEGNVTVPAHASCGLAGTVVLGNVYAQKGSQLTAVDVTVHGNLQTDGADALVLEGGSFVFGSVQVKGGRRVDVFDTRVVGNAEFIEVAGGLVVVRNSVTGSMLAAKNRAGSLVATNSVGGNLSCFDNTPPPFAVGNVVRGNAEGQCQEPVMEN